MDRVKFPGDGTIFWANESPGTTYEGTFVAEYGPDQYGYKYELENEIDGKIKLAGTTKLDARFAQLRIGAYCFVEYLGKKPSKRAGAQPYHDFEVSAGHADDWLKVPRRNVFGARS